MGPQHGYPYQQGDYNGQYNSPEYHPTSFQPGQVINNPFSRPYGDSPMGSPVPAPLYNQGYNPRVDFARQPSQATYMSRQPSLPAPAGDNVNDSKYVDLTRSSVTPFQAAQYEEISRQLDVTNPSSVLEAVTEEESRSGPPFASPISSSSPAHISSVPPSLPNVSDGPMSPVNSGFNPSAKALSSLAQSIDTPAYVPTQGKRPDTVYTLYDDEDAYGGI